MSVTKASLLQNVFTEADTPQELQRFLTSTLDINSVGEFVEYVVRDNYQEEWRNVVTGAFPLRAAVAAAEATEHAPAVLAVTAFTDISQRKLVAKMRLTYKVALGAEREEEDTKKKAREDQVAEDMEKPLDPDLKRQVAGLWTHDWQPIGSMKAAPKFSNRVVREFRALCVTNHTIEKAVTLLQAKQIVEPERLPVVPGSALVYEHTKPQTRQIHTLLEYFAALRLIMHTYAYAGGHRVESRIVPGTQVVFFPLGTAIEYHDTALHKTLEIAIPEHTKLRWVRYRDQRTRDEMAQFINEGMPGGEAILKALEKHKHLWDMEDKTVAADTSTSRQIVDGESHRSPSHQDHQPPKKAKGGGKAGGANELAGIKTSQRDSSKRLICGPFNGKRGCSKKEGQCPKRARHACNIIAPDGKVCEGRYGNPNHNAFSCPHAGR